MRLWDHPLVIVAAGVFLIVGGVYFRMLSLRSRSWPVVPGVITESHRTYSGTGTKRKASGSHIACDEPPRIVHRCCHRNCLAARRCAQVQRV